MNLRYAGLGIFKRLVRPEMIAIDIGGWIATTCVYAARGRERVLTLAGEWELGSLFTLLVVSTRVAQ